MLLGDRIQRARADRDGGQALVLVMGMIIIMGGVLAVIASSTIFGVYFTSQSKASVESQAAADAGVDALFAKLSEWDPVADASSVCTPSMSSGSPEFTAHLEYSLVKNPGDGDWAVGCPPSVDDTESFRIVSTGSAASKGMGDYDLGDEATVIGRWDRPATMPPFNHAIRADTFISAAGSPRFDSDWTDASLYTEGNFRCNAGFTVPGNLFVQQSLFFNRQDCKVAGDVFVTGDLYQAGSTSAGQVGGDLYVNGYIALGNSVPRLVSSFSKGAWDPKPEFPEVGGSVLAGGAIEKYCAIPGIVPVADSAFALFKSESEPNCRSAAAQYGTKIQMWVPLTSIPQVDWDADDNKFHRLSPETFAGYTEKSWTDATFTNTIISGGECTNLYTGGSMVIDTPTVIDTTSSCSKGVFWGHGGAFKITLNADLVIFAESFTSDMSMTIVSGDGEDHNIILATPNDSEDYQCPAIDDTQTSPDAAIDTKIWIKSGGWVQDDHIAALAYTTEGFRDSTSGSASFAGQIHSCQTILDSTTKITFRKLVTNEPQTLADFTAIYIRQG